MKVTGSAYTFVYITFGELAAWLIGWNLTLGYGISAVHTQPESAKFNAFVTLLNISVLLFVVAYGTLVFELDFLANVISCGTLQVFTFVNAGVLLLRMRPSLSGAGVVQRVLLFVIACFALSLSFVFDLPWTIQCAFAMMVIASFVFIYRLGKLGDLTTSFQCPLVPLVPCLGILANVYMMSSIPGDGWLGVFIWLSVGLVLYLCYGIRHSMLSDSTILHPLI
eukprot:jgi/Phyca11/17807/fgenesh1_pg.PHYCAscaffold_30_\